MPPPMFEKQIKLSFFPLHVDMFGHQIAFLTSDGSIGITNCLDIQKIEYFENIENLNQNEVIKMVLFKSNIEDKSWHLAFVINQPENQNLDLNFYFWT